MEKLHTKEEVRRLTWMLAITYMISYMTRINFGAIISEMSDATGIAKSDLSISLTGSFVFYGVGQLISGFLGDRVSPKRLVSLGLGCSAVMNFLLPHCQNSFLMMVIWCVNGLAQAFLWPPIVRIMTQKLSAEDYKQAVTRVSWGSSAGTILIYLLSPALIAALSWRAVFYTSATIGAVMLVCWSLVAEDAQIVKRAEGMSKTATAELAHPMIGLILLAIVLQGMLRDGITTWMPSLIAESFGLSNAVSILSGVLLPIFSILSFQAANMLYRRPFSNPLTCSGFLFGLGSIFALCISVCYGKNPVLTALLSAALTGCMHGVNLMLVCMIPQFFTKYGNTSLVSGILNACTYVGSACSTYAIAAVSEQKGWYVTVLLWFCIALLGAILCLCSRNYWRKHFMTELPDLEERK